MFGSTPIHSRLKGGSSSGGGFGRPANQPARPLTDGFNGPSAAAVDGNSQFDRVQSNEGADSFLSPVKRLNPMDIRELEDEYEDIVDGSVYSIPPPQTLSGLNGNGVTAEDTPSRLSEVSPSFRYDFSGQNQQDQQNQQNQQAQEREEEPFYLSQRESEGYEEPPTQQPHQHPQPPGSRQRRSRFNFNSLETIPDASPIGAQWGLTPIKLPQNTIQMPYREEGDVMESVDTASGSDQSDNQKHSEMDEGELTTVQENTGLWGRRSKPQLWGDVDTEKTQQQQLIKPTPQKGRTFKSPKTSPGNSRKINSSMNGNMRTNQLIANISNRSFNDEGDSTEIDDNDEGGLSAETIIYAVKSVLKPIHRSVVIIFNTIWISLRDLITPGLVQVVLAVAVLAIALYGGVYVVSKSGFSFQPSQSPSDPFVAPVGPPIDLEQWSSRLMSIESKLSHDSSHYSSLEAWLKDGFEKLQSSFGDLESQYHQELKSISQTLAQIGSQVSDQDDWSQKADKVLQEDRKLLYRLQQIISAQAEDFTNVYRALDEQKTSISEVASSLENIKDITNSNNEIDLDKFVSWDGLERKLATGINQLQEDFSRQIDQVSGKINGIVSEVLEKQRADFDSSATLDQFKSALSYFEEILNNQHDKLTEQLSKVETDVRDVYQSVDSRLREQKVQMDQDLSYRLANYKQANRPARKFDKPNFADRNIGAKINKLVTSPSFNPLDYAPFFYRNYRIFLGFFGIGKYIVHSSDNVLTPTMEPGKCWPIKGSRANLGISLPTDVELDSVGVEHIFHKSAIDPSTAPRLVSFWVEIPDPAKRQELEQLLGHSPQKNVGLPSSYVEVVSFEYNVFADEPLQVFELPLAVRHQKLRAKNVAFHFEENWGHPAASCIYRLLAFGNPSRASAEIGQDQTPGTQPKALETSYEQQEVGDEAGFGDDDALA
ncbi:spindle pole body protein Sad1 [Sugiyamaella lignohabitans]|uniref:Spindle pole body protein Sad1 n=1 Tax=Sugiyamaella lignohabitans TaxID=796027 RepID=A0A167CCL4_9ASCO|nr:spindle pole body protein Sad1 [Sugiyamaella lignohabitans]ANB11510.1 spindle pole body protein Sad1 [Sugiyamaella lignohabitans]